MISQTVDKFLLCQVLYSRIGEAFFLMPTFRDVLQLLAGPTSKILLNCNETRQIHFYVSSLLNWQRSFSIGKIYEYLIRGALIYSRHCKSDYLE